MSLNAAIEAELGNLRAEATARMTSTAVVKRRTGRTTQNEQTGREAPVWDTVYTGPFRLKASAGATRTVTVAEVEYQQATAEGHFPAETTDLADGDFIHITVGEWAGSTWRIVEATKGDQRTSRRVPIAETMTPEEW